MGPKSVNILIPTTWNDTRFETEISSEYFYEDGAIRIQNPNPLHGDMPYTLQLGGCGVLGEYIHLTPNYLVNLFEKSEDEIGPHENIFVHEWAKLRSKLLEKFLCHFQGRKILYCIKDLLISDMESLKNMVILVTNNILCFTLTMKMNLCQIFVLMKL